jgi:hypothetical protein
MVTMRTSPAGFPMAPSVVEWEEVTYDEMPMPERDRHSRAKARALDALRGYFSRQRRRIHISRELPVYYPVTRLRAELERLAR